MLEASFFHRFTLPVSLPGLTGQSSIPGRWLLDRPVKPGDDKHRGRSTTWKNALAGPIARPAPTIALSHARSVQSGVSELQIMAYDCRHKFWSSPEPARRTS